MRMLLLYKCMNKMTLSIVFRLHVSSMKIMSNVMKRLREHNIDAHVRGKDKAMRFIFYFLLRSHNQLEKNKERQWYGD